MPSRRTRIIPNNPKLSDAMTLAVETAAHDNKDTLVSLPKAERLEHHRKQISYIIHHQGFDGVQAYKLRFPEAEAVRTISEPVLNLMRNERCAG